MAPLFHRPAADGEMLKLSHKESSRYTRLWWYFVSLMAVVSLTPLVILTLVNAHQYQKALKTEMLFPTSRLLSNTKRTLEAVIAERKNALRLISSEKSHEELVDEESLTATFANLRQAFGGFVDLGLIDSEGNQAYYTGPYMLKGKNYRDQAWFHEVNLRDAYVSDVFMGFRNFPHFVVGVKQSRPEGNFYILRATIDMQLLNQQIASLDLGPASDVFMINREGILQTQSRLHGQILEPCRLALGIPSTSKEVVREFSEKGNSYILGYASIEQSPFILVILQDQKDLMKTWIASRTDPILFLIGSSLLILAVVLGGTSYMVNRLREADIRRARVFHNLEYTNKMASIGRLAAGVAHEINNPLAIINEKAGLLKDMVTLAENFTQREKIEALANSILNSVERCSGITHRLLGFARRMNVQFELINLELLIKEVLGFLGKELGHRNITAHFEVPEDFPTIESDRGQLQQVFLNIISNALAALSDGGWMRFILKQSDAEHVAVVICDNGKGISPENLKHIFEPFFSTKGEFGTGLGLSITHDIIGKLGGQIDVESELGKGTCFTIMLPNRKSPL